MSNNSHCKKLSPACQLLFRRWMVEIKAKVSSCSRERSGRTPSAARSALAGDLATLQAPCSLPLCSAQTGPSTCLLLLSTPLSCTGQIIFPEPFKAAFAVVPDSYGKQSGVQTCSKALHRCLPSSALLQALPTGQGSCQPQQRLFAKAPAADLSEGLHGPGALQSRAAQPHATRPARPAKPPSPRPAPQAAAVSTQVSKTRQRRGTYVCDGPSVGDG